MMYIWPEISHFLQFNSANNERLAQEYSAWKWLMPLHHFIKHQFNQSIKLLCRLNPERRQLRGAQILSMMCSSQGREQGHQGTRMGKPD